MQIKHLGNFRYSITGLTNDVSTLLSPATVSLHVTMATTYAQLIEKHVARLQSDTTSLLSLQVERNHMTALRGWLHFVGKSETSTVGVEMADDFAATIKRYISTLDISDRSKSDRRSLLNAWRLTYDMLATAPDRPIRGRERARAELVPTSPSAFEVGLKAALRKAGLTPKAAARRAGVSMSAIGRWTRGALPNERSQHTMSRLEDVLELPKGHLSALLRQTIGDELPTVRNEYRELHKKRCAAPYRQNPNLLSPTFLMEWQDLLRHKSTTRSKDKKRSGTGRWSATGSANSQGAISGISTLDGLHYASASVLWGHVSSMMGFLQLSHGKGGWELPPEVAQTLAWLAVPEAVEAYMEFSTERAGRLRHTGHAVFCSAIAALTHPVHGFITQNTQLPHQLPAQYAENRSWQDMCAETHSYVTEWKSTCTDVSRSPEQAVRHILEHTNPLEPIFSAMSRLHNIALLAKSHSTQEAIARRDELLLGLLISNPLRMKNIIGLSYLPDNSGNVYQTAKGEWRIRLRHSDFKNGKRTTGNRTPPYDVKVAEWLHPLLTDYVKDFRAVLRRNSDADNLFLAANGRPLNGMTHRVLYLTRTFIPGSGGFGPHGFRHIVATDWLRRNPNDFLTVAQLLNDTLEVVIRTYAHLKRDDALTRHSTQLSAFLPAHLRNHK